MYHKKNIILLAVGLSSCALAMRDPELPTLQITEEAKGHIFKGKLVYKETEEVKSAYSYLNPLPSLTSFLGYLSLKPAPTKRSGYFELEGYHAYCSPKPGQPDPEKTISDVTTPQENGVFHMVWGATIDGVYYTKKVGSTVYPISWCVADTLGGSEQNIIDKIVLTYNKQQQVKKEGSRFVVTSVADNGDYQVPIESVVDEDGSLITAYPLLENEYHPDNE